MRFLIFFLAVAFVLAAPIHVTADDDNGGGGSSSSSSTSTSSKNSTDVLLLPDFPAMDPSYSEVHQVCQAQPQGDLCKWGMEEIEGRRTPWVCRKVLNHIPVVRRVC